MDGIVYGAVASLASRDLENVMYCIDGGMQTVVLRAFTAVPAHAAFGAIMGYHFQRSIFRVMRLACVANPICIRS